MYNYLMIKECVVDGKLYLCKKQADTDQEAEKYTGSGLKVLEYKKLYGNNCMRHKKTLLKMPLSEVREFNNNCYMVSKQLDVVNSELYLNVIDEIGQGGSTKKTNGMTGKKYVFKGSVNKAIKPDLIPVYISNGWKIGISPDRCKQISIRQQGRLPWNKGKRMKPFNMYKTKPYEKKTDEEKFKARSLARQKLYSNPEYKKFWSLPRKPLLTLKEISTGRTIKIGRHEAVKTLKVSLVTLFKGRISQGYKLIASTRT